MSGVTGRLLPGGLWVGKLVRLLGAAPSSFPRRGCGAWAGFWLPKMTPYLPWQNPGTGSEGVSLETGSANGGGSNWSPLSCNECSTQGGLLLGPSPVLGEHRTVPWGPQNLVTHQWLLLGSLWREDSMGQEQVPKDTARLAL